MDNNRGEVRVRVWKDMRRMGIEIFFDSLNLNAVDQSRTAIYGI